MNKNKRLIFFILIIVFIGQSGFSAKADITCYLNQNDMNYIDAFNIVHNHKYFSTIRERAFTINCYLMISALFLSLIYTFLQSKSVQIVDKITDRAVIFTITMLVFSVIAFIFTLAIEPRLLIAKNYDDNKEYKQAVFLKTQLEKPSKHIIEQCTKPKTPIILKSKSHVSERTKHIYFYSD